MAYEKIGDDRPILRDYLAAERTHLASERTLLAYERSAFVVLVTSLTILKLFGTDRIMLLIGITLLPIALFIAVFGILRFRATAVKLAAFENLTIISISSPDEQQPLR